MLNVLIALSVLSGIIFVIFVVGYISESIVGGIKDSASKLGLIVFASIFFINIIAVASYYYLNL